MHAIVEPSNRPLTFGRKLRRVGHADGYPHGGIGHWCPACRAMHVFATDVPDSRGHRWTWNGNETRPTFWPDRDVVTKGFKDLAPAGHCHYTLDAGTIAFATDCTHALKGQRVPLPDFPVHLLY